MNKEELLRSIAETGYNVGFGAKKNFATHDIVQKVPSLIGLVSLTAGVYALVYEPLNSKWIAATLLLLGIVSICVTYYENSKADYSNEGERLTILYDRLRDLYYDVKGASEDVDLTGFRQSYDEIKLEKYDASLSKQILFSDWYAHYKFFWQHQIEWIDEQKKFTFWRDKIPLSLIMFIMVILVSAFAMLIHHIYCSSS